MFDSPPAQPAQADDHCRKECVLEQRAMDTEEFVWCLVANVSREPSDGELTPSLKHFAPGAKLYCFPSDWGDGGERIRALGRHRGSGSKLINIVVASKWLTNWRVQKVFHPYVISAMRGYWDDSDSGRERALKMLAFLNRKSS